MLRSVKEEKGRHARMALRIGVPTLLFVVALVYAVFFRDYPINWSLQNIAIMGAMVFVVVYFIFFALELSRRETLLDRVTGGYHYESFVDRVLRERPRTLSAARINNLSVINEAFGVRKADELLRSLVEAMDREVLYKFGKHAWIGRKNGAEFLLAIDEEPEVVEKELERFFAAHRQLDDVDVDFVFAVIRNNIDDPEKAIEQLRDLLVQKERRPDVVAEVPVSDARRLSQAEREVVDALERKDLFLLFRPLRNLHSGEVDLYEVSVKMRAENGETIAPRDFLPIINRQNLGESYDLLIVERVLEDARLTDDTVALSFNLSPFSLRKNSFLEEFHRRLEASKVEPPRLIVELYERKSYHRLDEYLKRLKILKRWGVRLCLDNFGSSNASMEYLRHFPFDMIEFDREYTFDLEKGKSLSILRSFVTMAQDMGILTGAKWVDDSRKIRILNELGVDYIQGFAAGKIMKEEEFVRKYNPQRSPQ